MKKILLALLVFPLVVSFANAQDSISVLFIGNSYTYVNDLPGMLGALAGSLGKEITVDSKTNGGYTFQNHTTDPLTYTKIHSKPWDVVVIQGQSQEPSFSDAQVNAQTLPYALQLSDSIRANNFCSNVMFYMTWGRQNGDPQWSEINTFEKMNTRLYNAYMRMADSSDRAMVSPVGRVWTHVRQNYPAINLYNADQSHPSAEGTYLAACTFYAGLFQQSPVGANYYGGLPAATAGILQQSAAAVVLDSLEHFHLHPVNEPTQAYFSVVQNGSTIELTNESSGATAYSWDFGDNQGASSEDAQHTFAADGTYLVRLIASSVCNSDTFSIQVQVGALGLLPGAVFDQLSIKTTEKCIELSTAEAEFFVRIFSVDGKLLDEKKVQNGNPVIVPRMDQVQIIHFVDSTGFVKISRFF